MRASEQSADAPATGSQRFLIVSHTFGATLEVGARRVNAIADHMTSRGHSVDVIYWPDPKFEGDSASLFLSRPTVRLYPVSDPPSALVSWLVKAQRVLRRFSAERQPGDSSQAQGGSESDTREALLPTVPRGFIEWLRHALLSFVLSFNGKKRWAIRAALLGMRLTKQHRYACVISSAPPAVVCVVATWLSARSKIPSAIDLRDPWYTISLSQHPIAPVRRLDALLERWCLGHASLITCASPGIKRKLIAQYPDLSPKTHIVFNGFEESDRIFSPIPFGKLHLLFAGALYLKRNPFSLLEAISRLAKKDDIDRRLIHFTLIGECESWDGIGLVHWCRDRGIEDIVSVLPSVPRQELSSLRATANVLVNFAQGQPNQIPAKTFEMMASERCVLTITEGDNDTANILAAAHMRGIVDDRVPEALDHALEKLYARLVRRETPSEGPELDIDQFSRARQNAIWYHLLLNTLSAKMRHRV